MQKRYLAMLTSCMVFLTACSNWFSPQGPSLQQVVENSANVQADVSPQIASNNAQTQDVQYLASLNKFVEAKSPTVIVVSDGMQREIVQLANVVATDATPEQQVKDVLTSLLGSSKSVRIESVNDNAIHRNNFNEIVAFVWADNKLVNETLVKDGFLDITQDFPKHADILKKAKEHAVNNKLGIWYVDETAESAKDITMVYYPNGTNIVIHNKGKKDVNLSKWVVRDVVSGATLIIPENTRIKANESLTINANANPLAKDIKTLIWKNVINDTKVDLELYNADNKLIASYKSSVSKPTTQSNVNSDSSTNN